MPNLSSVVNYFPTPNEGFATTLGSTISSGATTVPLAGTSGLTNGSVFVGIIEPGAANQQVFTGTIDISGSQITSVVWTRGTNASHLGGVAIVDYVTGTTVGMISAGVQKHANQDGSLIGSVVRTALNQTAQTGAGWTSIANTPNTVTANGNRSYTCVYNSVNLTGTISPGMRLMHQRTVAAPTQCTSLNGTTQYYSKTSPAGMTFTNNFVVSAWIKVSSYAQGVIASRYNGTSGWTFRLESTGQLAIYGLNAGSTNFTGFKSYQSVPLNKWVHVAAQLDMTSATNSPTVNYIMFNGVDVPATQTQGGTNPTALIQAGNLEIGSQNAGTLFFPGKIAQVAVYSAKVTQANVLATISQGLAGTETSLISAYSFNNSINDLNANANNLTANGSAVATNADSPFGGQASGAISSTLDYGIVTSASFSTNTTLVVQVPEGCTIPTSGGVSAVSYATVKAPYGMPVQKGKWRLVTAVIADSGNVTVAGTTPTNINGMQLSVPVGEWEVGAQYVVGQEATVGGSLIGRTWLNSTVTPSIANALATIRNGSGGASETEVHLLFTRSVPVSLSSVTVHTCVFYFEAGSGTGSYRLFGTAIGDISLLYADNSYL